MKYSIGIVPPDPIYTTIANIQTKFGDNRLEPHITLRPPVKVADEANWMEAIEEVCNNFFPLEISLQATGYFGKQVLFINVQSNQLEQLHEKIINAVTSFEELNLKASDQPSFHPHLTLGRKWCGFTQADFDAMEILVNEYLSKNPVLFTTSFVRIYGKPSGQRRYEKLRDLPLTSHTDQLHYTNL